MIKIAFISGANSRKAGGVFFTVTSLLNELVKTLDVAVIAHADEYSKEDSSTFNEKVKILEYKTLFGNIMNTGFSIDIHKNIERFSPQIIHQQGIWLYYSKAVLKNKNRFGTKVIIQPHGMLDRWAIQNSSYKKKIVGFLYEYENLRKADCLHALNLEEFKAIRDLGYRNPVAVIPNGVILPSVKMPLTKHVSNTLLYIGRIHPKKGLDLLINAINHLNVNYPFSIKGWKIRIGGWDQNGHQQELENKVKLFDLGDFVEFIGPVFNEEKEKELMNASGFILPSFSEGLPMTILEAWSYQLPVLMTNECNLRIGFENSAAIQIELDYIDIANKLKAFFEMDEQQKMTIGNNGYELVKEKYSWGHVANKTIMLYDWLLGNCAKPDFVFVD